MMFALRKGIWLFFASTIIIQILSIHAVFSKSVIISEDHGEAPQKLDVSARVGQAHDEIVAAIKRELNVLKERWNADKSSISATLKELDGAKLSLAKLEKEYESSKHELGQMKEAHERQLIELDQQYRKALGDLKEESREQEEELIEARNELGYLRRAHDEKSGHLVELEAENKANIEELKRSHESQLAEQQEKSQAELASLRADSQEKEQQLNKLRSTIEKLESKIENQQESRKLHEKLGAEVEEKQKELAELRAKFEAQRDEELANKSHEAKLLFESMTDVDKKSRCLRYMILWNQKQRLTACRVQSIAALDLNSIDTNSVIMGQDWTSQKIEEMFVENEPMAEIKNEILECMKSTQEVAGESQTTKNSIKSLSAELEEERKKLELIDSTSFMTDAARLEILYISMKDDTDVANRCLKYVNFFAISSEQLATSAIFDLAKHDFRLWAWPDDNDPLLKRSLDKLRELADQIAEKQPQISGEINKCINEGKSFAEARPKSKE